MSIQIIQGDCRTVLPTLAAGSVQCVVTSPPYFGLRDYGTATWVGGDPACDHRSPTMRAGRNEDRAKLAGSEATNSAQLLLAHRTGCGKCGATKVDSQIGLEVSPAEYIAEMVAVFREVWRVLRDDGVVFLNLGDSYASGGNGVGSGKQLTNVGSWLPPKKAPDGYKPKDLLMIPARVAIALQADGWWLRSDIIWHKPNPMPESVTDRPTSSHEHVFLLTKSGDALFWTHRDKAGTRTQPPPDYRWVHTTTKEERDTEPTGWATVAAIKKRWRRVSLWSGHDYFYDADAVREIALWPDGPNAPDKIRSPMGQGFTRKALAGPTYERHRSSIPGGQSLEAEPSGTRNLRNVWTIATHPYPEAHFATFPPELAERCIKAGTSEKGRCPSCGAPWARTVSKGEPDERHRIASGADSTGGYSGQSTKNHDAHGVQNASDVKRRILEGMRLKTYGWQTTCDCPLADPVPCTVLDPFSGAGTTALVADRLGRNAIGIELNPEYSKLARNRITDDSPLFADVS